MKVASLRARLTRWYVVSMMLVLGIYAAGVFALLSQRIGETRDHHLEEDLEVAQEMVVLDGSTARWRVDSVFDQGYDAGERRWIEIWSRDGRLLFARAASAEAATQASLPPPREEDAGYATIRLADGRRLRTLTKGRSARGTPYLFRVARVDRIFEEELRPTLIVLVLGIPLAAALAGLGGYLLARRALAPIGRMAARAESISADRLSERLPVENPDDELGQLATVVNRTFARLERSFELLRQFTADASHDLRTPLTALRSVGEVGLREPRTGDQYREIVGSMLEETDRLTRLIDSLLTISRADAGHVKLDREPMDLGDLAREVTTYLGVLAEDKSQQLVVEGAAPVPVVADRLVLRQALVNLVDNAIKYSPASAPIRIRVSARDGHGVIAVCDEGPGIPAEHRARVFDRFYRVDKSRARASGGAGLGLSIARWAVEVNGGHIELETEEGRGCQFRIVLPLAPA